jgi:large subunit ribosomal protein L18
MALRTGSNRKKIKFRIRKRIFGTSDIPRLCVYKSNKFIYVQLINDSEGRTISSASSREFNSPGVSVDKAQRVGKLLAERAMKSGVSKIVFDRSGYSFHGRVKALADGAREIGLEF